MTPQSDSQNTTSKQRKRRTPARSAVSAEIAVLSDIHSNLHALEAVLAECKRRKINRFVCLGDIVGYGARPAECLKLIRSLKCPTVIGNHDFYVAHEETCGDLNEYAQAGVEYSISHVNAAAKKWLRDLPEVIIADTVTLVHSSLPEPLDWEYIFDSGDARQTMLAQSTPICFYGHTHVPKLFVQSGAPTPEIAGEVKFRLSREGRYLINPGSVGQPRGEGDPRARFAVFHPGEMTVEFVKVEYDVEAAAEAIREAGLPEFLAERLMAGV